MEIEPYEIVNEFELDRIDINETHHDKKEKKFQEICIK